MFANALGTTRSTFDALRELANRFASSRVSIPNNATGAAAALDGAVV